MSPDGLKVGSGAVKRSLADGRFRAYVQLEGAQDRSADRAEITNDSTVSLSIITALKLPAKTVASSSDSKPPTTISRANLRSVSGTAPLSGSTEREVAFRLYVPLRPGVHMWPAASKSPQAADSVRVRNRDGQS
jgi:hypothetical protein